MLKEQTGNNVWTEENQNTDALSARYRGLSGKMALQRRWVLSDTAQAARILERTFHENHFSIQDDHNLRLHNLDLPVGKIVTAFVENGLEVSEAHTCEESLEDYFKRVTGGEGIA